VIATEVLTRFLAAKIAVFVGVLAVLVLLSFIDPAYDPTETL
jgi:hypothetical protein